MSGPRRDYEASLRDGSSSGRRAELLDRMTRMSLVDEFGERAVSAVEDAARATAPPVELTPITPLREAIADVLELCEVVRLTGHPAVRRLARALIHVPPPVREAGLREADQETWRQRIVEHLGPQRMSLYTSKDIDRMATGAVIAAALRAEPVTEEVVQLIQTNVSAVLFGAVDDERFAMVMRAIEQAPLRPAAFDPAVSDGDDPDEPHATHLRLRESWPDCADCGAQAMTDLDRLDAEGKHECETCHEYSHAPMDCEAFRSLVAENKALREVERLAREFSDADRAYLDAPMDGDDDELYRLRDAREALTAALHHKDGAS